MDEGTLTDSQGRKVDFKNTIVIMTSNIGTSKIVQEKKMGFGNSELSGTDIEKSVIRELKKHKMTTPEFLNRIDDVIVFNALEREDIHSIIDIELDKLLHRILDLGYTLKLSDKAKDYIADKGFDKKYGARPLKRAIQKYIEDALAEEIVNSKLTEGDTIFMDLDDKKTELTIKIKKGEKVKEKKTEAKE